MSTFQQLMKAPVRHISVRGELTLPSGKIILLSGSDIASFSISEGVSDGVLLGACPSAGLRLCLCDPKGQFLYLGEKRGAASAAGAQVVLFLRALDEDGQWLEQKLGRFFVTDMTGRENDVVCTLQATDALGYLFDGVFEHTLVYPAALRDLAQSIARQAGMEVNTDFPGNDFVIPTRVDFENRTLRGALGCLCAAAGCFAYVNREGQLRIQRVKDTREAYEIGAENVLLRQYGEVSFGPVNALRIETYAAPRNAGATLLISDQVGVRPDTMFTLSGNPLFPFGETWAQELGRQTLNHLQGFSLVRSLLQWQGDASLELGRALQLVDKRGCVTLTQVTRQVLKYDRGFTMQTDCTVRTPFASGAGVIISPDGRVQGGSITGNIDGGLIREGTLGVTALSAHSITGQYIAAHAIDAENLSAGAVTADKIASKTITADKLQSELITADSGLIAEGAIGTAQIANGSITDAKIVELTANKINAGTLSVERLVVVGNDKSIVYAINEANGTPQLSQTTIDGGSLTKRTITADKIVAESITSAELAANAVTANKILSGAVTTEKLDALSVTTDKLAAESVTASKIAADVGRTLDLSSNESVKASVVAGVSNSAMTLTKDEFTLAFDGKNVMEVDSDSAVFDVDTLTATGQIIGNVVNTQKAVTVTVPAGASIQSAIDNLNKYLLGDVNIYVQGQHTENVTIRGFYGMGILYLRFQSGAVLSGSIDVRYCKSVSIIGSSQTECCFISTSTYGIYAFCVDRLHVYMLNMHGDGTGRAIQCNYTPCTLIDECTFAGYDQGVAVSYNTQASMYNCIGGGTGDNAITHAVNVTGGAMLTLYGNTRPMGNLYDADGAGLLRDIGTVPTSATGDAPVVNATITATPSVTYSCVSSTAVGNSSLVHDWGWYANPFQGKYSAAGGYMHGIWIYSDGLSAVRSAISGKTIVSATLTVKRADAYGTDGKTVRLWYHDKTAKPSGSWPSAVLTDTGLTATVDRGKSVTFELPDALVDKIKDGAVKGFGISSMKNTDLMQFDAAVCDLTIVYR